MMCPPHIAFVVAIAHGNLVGAALALAAIALIAMLLASMRAQSMRERGDESSERRSGLRIFGPDDEDEPLVHIPVLSTRVAADAPRRAVADERGEADASRALDRIAAFAVRQPYAHVQPSAPAAASRPAASVPARAAAPAAARAAAAPAPAVVRTAAAPAPAVAPAAAAVPAAVPAAAARTSPPAPARAAVSLVPARAATVTPPPSPAPAAVVPPLSRPHAVLPPLRPAPVPAAPSLPPADPAPTDVHWNGLPTLQPAVDAQPARSLSGTSELSSSRPPAPRPDRKRGELPLDGDILLVEDDSAVAEMYRLLLHTRCYATRHALDGAEGIAMVREERPALILLDMMMPRMDGIQFLEALRSWPKTSAIPVVVLANVDTSDLVDRAMSLGAVEYLVKAQTRPQVLARALPHWLRGNRALSAVT